MSDAGYDGQDTEPRDAVRFTMERVEEFYSGASYIHRLLRDGEPVGYIRLSSPEEARWLEERVTGTYDPEIEGPS